VSLVFQYFEVTLSWVDNGAQPAPRTYALNSTVTDPADAQTAAEALIPLALALTDDALASYRVSSVYAETSLDLPDSTGVQNQNQAIITTPILGDPLKSATFTIPAAKAALFVGTEGKSANIVNTTNAALLAFLALFTTPGNFTVSDGEKITTTGIYGKRRHTKSNNG